MEKRISTTGQLNSGSENNARSTGRHQGVGKLLLVTSLGALLLIAGIGVLALALGATTISLKARQTSASPQSALDPAPIITQAKFANIREHMTYAEVCAVIGVPGSEVGRSEIAGDRTVMYNWSNANGSNMNALFQNGELNSKTQSGLR